MSLLVIRSHFFFQLFFSDLLFNENNHESLSFGELELRSRMM
jgi:hypothetical protein